MGVSTNFYTMYGIRIEWDDALFESFDIVYDACDLNIIFDGMSGEYIYFGKLLYDSGDARYGFEGGDSFTEHDINDLQSYAEQYMIDFTKWFPDHLHLLEGKTFKIISFAHYH